MKHCTFIVLVLFAVPWLLDPPEGSACGPFPFEAQFTFVHQPPPSFLHGELGIVKPEYYRRHLIVAYRYLSHAPLTTAEVAALNPEPPQASESPASPESGMQPVDRWIAQRNAVVGSQPVRWIQTLRSVYGNGYYGAYENCLSDAFDSATATLVARIARWGLKSAQTAEWIRGQDAVFSNCDGHGPNEPQVPAALPADADPLLRADRQYQIAAAAFYGGRFTTAEKDFREVAANPESPWREWGPYLTARALIREGTILESPTALAAAEKALEAIVHDQKQKRWQASAQGLLGFVRARLHPDDRMVELGVELSMPGLGAGIQQAITDYTAIWDRQGHGPVARSDLADWITAFQARDEKRSLERWSSGGGTAWFIAALVAAPTDGPATPELLAEARKLRPTDPAYATAAYHAIELLRARGQPDEARRWTDAALAAKLPMEVQNPMRAERLALARDWTEFLRYAPRRPVAMDQVATDEPLSDAGKGAEGPAFDRDAVDALNRKVPLGLWVDASRNPLVPGRLQAQIAQSGWVRAVLLGHSEQAHKLARRVAELSPELAAAMHAYEAEKAADAARFNAILLMLRTPGLEPVVRAGFGRELQVTRRDPFRDNWWKLKAPSGNGEPPADNSPALFLNEPQRDSGAKEWDDLLAAAATGSTCLCDAAVTWARGHPRDPRVPEGLYLAVLATHYGPTDEDTSACSHKAFEFLHAHYPKSEWAKETKYWY